ncbi:MAG TPA: hypothetical protein VIX19_11545 [Terriglobales bacterium]
MAWLSRNNFTPSDFLQATDLNNLANDLQTWGGNVNGGGYTLSNVILPGSQLPLTTLGDLVVYGPTGVTRLPVGTNGQVLTADSTKPDGLGWEAPPGGGGDGGGAVDSVFGRTGNVVAVAGDYSVGDVTGAMADPLTTLGDLVVYGPSGTTRLGAGTAGQVLTVGGPDGVGWAAASGDVTSVFGRTGAVAAAAGDYTVAQITDAMPDPLTTLGDLVVYGAGGVTRLPVGANGQVLTSDNATVAWAYPVSEVVSVFGRSGAVVAQADDYTVAQVTGAMPDPLTTFGDLLVYGAAGIARLGVGANGQVLTANNAAADGLAWAPASPLTTLGDLLVYGSSGVVRLPVGTNGQVLMVDAGDPLLLGWAAPPDGGGSGGAVDSVFGRTGNVVAQPNDYDVTDVNGALADPTTTLGDIIVHGPSGITRLGVGADGQVLTANNAAADGIAWVSAGYWQGGAGGAIYYSGNVGIATATPQNALEVNGLIRVTGNNNASPPVSGACVEFYYDPSRGLGAMDAFDYTANAFKELTIDGLPLILNELTGGNVGIGTMDPSVLLSTGTSVQTIKIATFDPGAGADTLYGFGVASGYLTFGANIAATGTPQMVLSAAGELGVGTQDPIATLHVLGPNQATAAINTANLAGCILADDANAAVNAGGTIVFSAGSSAWRFAAIKALATNGSGNTQGDLVFSTRHVGTDGTLTESMRIVSNGNVSINAPNNVDFLNIYGIPPGGYGQLRLLSDNYGFFIRNDGANVYFMTTANGDPYGEWISPFPITIDLSNNCVGFRSAPVSGWGVAIDSLIVYGPGYFGGAVRVGEGLTVTGGVSVTGDISVARGDGTGYVMYAAGGSDIYLGFNGEQLFASTSLYVTGNITAAGNCNITGQYLVNGNPLPTGGWNPWIDDVSASRALNTTYTNNGPVMIVIVSAGVGLYAVLDGIVNGLTVASVGQSNAGGDTGLCVTFVVPTGCTYSANCSNAGPPTWFEFH